MTAPGRSTLPPRHQRHIGAPEPAQVTVPWLASQIGNNPDLRLLDISVHTPGPPIGFIEGALDLDWEGTFGGPPSICPSPLILASVMSQLGIGNGHTIVLYDEGHGARSLPVYRWLRRYGQQRVFVLTGGRKEWLRRQRSLVHTSHVHSPASFTVKIGANWPSSPALSLEGRRTATEPGSGKPLRAA